MGIRKISTLVFAIILSFNGHGQTVGLVLSGGGAKGLSHIGVIKVLEENNIPIDYITGTSIGAIVGAMYAIGYTPEQMEELVTSEEFLRWSEGKIKEEDIYYFKKPKPDASWLELDFAKDTAWKPLLPTYVVPNHLMDFAFMRILSPASAACNYNFDSLLVPFRCVAADIYASEEVVFKKGDLAKAVRASMTYPFYFRPIKIDGKLLMDGGLYNNFPADVMAESFAPDVMIGSKVTSNSDPPEEDDLLLQLENIFMRKSNFELPADTAFLIEPETEDIELMNFEQAGAIIEKGTIAAKSKVEDIKNVIQRRVTEAEMIVKREKFTSKQPELRYQSVITEGINEDQEQYVKKSITFSKPTFNAEALKDKYIKLATDEVVGAVYPYSTYDKQSGLFDLNLKIDAKKEFSAQVGGNISSGSFNQAFAGVKYKFLDKQAVRIHANTHYGRLYSSAHISGRIDFPGTFPFSLDGGFTFNRWDYFKSNVDVFFEDIKPSYIIENEFNFQTNFSFPLGDNAKGAVGGALANKSDRYYQIDNFLKSDTSDKTNFNLHTYHLTYEENTLNYKQYPNAGKILRFHSRYVFGRESHKPGTTAPVEEVSKGNNNYLYFQFLYDDHTKLFDWLSAGLYTESVLSTQRFFQNYMATMINAPDFSPFPHSKALFLENFRSHIYTAGGIKTIVHITDRLDWRSEGYLFLPYRKIIETNEYDAEYAEPIRFHHIMGSSSVVYHTPIGPASLSINYYDKKGKQTYLFFSFGYLLFNHTVTE